MSDAGAKPELDVADVYDDGDEPYMRSASSILAQALKKLRLERLEMADYVRDSIEQLAIARARFSEAVIAEREVERLLKGDLFTLAHPDPDEIDADEIADFLEAARATEPVLPVAREPEPVEEPAPPLPATPEPPPKETVASRVASVVEGALELLWKTYPHGELDARKVALHTGEELNRVYSALHHMAHEGRIQYVQRPDENRLVVLRIGDERPLPEVTEKQEACLSALKSFADEGGRATISFGRLAASDPRLSQSTISQVIDALAHKGLIKIVDRGNSVRPGIYQIGRAPVARPKGDVTAALMGDPPPSRSALAASGEG